MENKTCLKPPTRYPPVSSNVAIWKFPILIRGGFDGFDGKKYINGGFSSTPSLITKGYLAHWIGLFGKDFGKETMLNLSLNKVGYLEILMKFSGQPILGVGVVQAPREYMMYML